MVSCFPHLEYLLHTRYWLILEKSSCMELIFRKEIRYDT